MKKTDEVQSMVTELLKSDLSPNQSRFIKGLKKYYKHFGTLSEKQNSCLISIYDQAFQKAELNNLIQE